MTKEDNENKWAKFQKDHSKSLEEGIVDTFTWGIFTIKILDLIFAYIITLIIEQPLLSFAHYIRTLEWNYEFNFLSYLIFIGFMSIIVIFFAKISKKIRNRILDKLESQKNTFYINFLSFIFAILVIDVFVEPLLALSDLLATGIWVFDLGGLIDRVIASIIILFIYMIIYELSKVYWKYS